MPGVSDYHNALKLGFDPAPEVEAYPVWMTNKVPHATLVTPTSITTSALDSKFHIGYASANFPD